MNNASGSDERSQLSLLRDQLAQAISRDIEWQQRLEELEHEKTGLSIDAAAAALIQAINSGETAATVGALGTRRYAISQLQVSLRGLFALQGNELILILPHPEQRVPPDQLSNVHITLSQIPNLNRADERRVLAFLNAAQTPEQIATAVEFPRERDVGIRVAQRLLDRRKELGTFTSLRQVAEVPQVGPERFTEIVIALSESASETNDAVQALVQALERAQTAFSAWNRERGVATARDVVAQTTHLLASVQRWGDEDFVRTTHTLAQAMGTFGQVLTGDIPAQSLEPFQASAQHLLELTQRLGEPDLATPVHMKHLATAVQRVTQQYEIL